MNTDCDKIIENIDNSTDDYRCYKQKNMIQQVIQQIFCEMLIGGRKIVNGNMLFEITNIRTNVQMIIHSLKGYFTNVVKEILYETRDMLH